MSAVEFKKSITPNELYKWKSINDSVVSEKLITIYPGGSISHTFIPLDNEDKFITTKYRLVIKYKSNDNQIDDGINCLFDMVMMMEGSLVDEINHQTITVRAQPIDTSVMCDVIFNSAGGYADSFMFRLRNNSGVTIEIESIELFPSYSLNDDTITIVQSMLPTLTHSTNLNPINVVDKEVLLIRTKAGTSSDTSLGVHFFVNGYSSENTTATLYILMNDINLPYSPLKIDIPRGNFLISVPTCVIRAKSGGNELKATMRVNNGNVVIDSEKVQCSIEGKGLINGGGAARPGAYVTERYNLNVVDLNNKLKVKDDSVSITIQKPKVVILAETKPISKKNIKTLQVKTSYDIEKNYER